METVRSSHGTVDEDECPEKPAKGTVYTFSRKPTEHEHIPCKNECFQNAKKTQAEHEQEVGKDPLLTGTHEAKRPAPKSEDIKKPRPLQFGVPPRPLLVEYDEISGEISEAITPPTTIRARNLEPVEDGFDWNKGKGENKEEMADADDPVDAGVEGDGFVSTQKHACPCESVDKSSTTVFDTTDEDQGQATAQWKQDHQDLNSSSQAAVENASCHDSDLNERDDSMSMDEQNQNQNRSMDEHIQSMSMDEFNQSMSMDEHNQSMSMDEHNQSMSMDEHNQSMSMDKHNQSMDEHNQSMSTDERERKDPITRCKDQRQGGHNEEQVRAEEGQDKLSQEHTDIRHSREPTFMAGNHEEFPEQSEEETMNNHEQDAGLDLVCHEQLPCENREEQHVTEYEQEAASDTRCREQLNQHSEEQALNQFDQEANLNTSCRGHEPDENGQTLSEDEQNVDQSTIHNEQEHRERCQEQTASGDDQETDLNTSYVEQEQTEHGPDQIWNEDERREDPNSNSLEHEQRNQVEEPSGPVPSQEPRPRTGELAEPHERSMTDAICLRQPRNSGARGPDRVLAGHGSVGAVQGWPAARGVRSAVVVDLNSRAVDQHCHLDVLRGPGLLREIVQLDRAHIPATTNVSSEQGAQEHSDGEWLEENMLEELIHRFRCHLQEVDRLCLVCTERPINTVLLNCHDLVVCDHCARHMQVFTCCPLPGCGAPVLCFIVVA